MTSGGKSQFPMGIPMQSGHLGQVIKIRNPEKKNQKKQRPPPETDHHFAASPSRMSPTSYR
jgi:hypothetical protein